MPRRSIAYSFLFQTARTLVEGCLIVKQNRLSLLDSPVWNALSTTHSSFAEGNELAKRYPVSVAPLAATRDRSAKFYHSIAQLLGPAGMTALAFAALPVVPAGWTVVRVVLVSRCCGMARRSRRWSIVLRI